MGVGGRGVIVGGKGDAVEDGWGVIEDVFDGVGENSFDSTPALLRVKRVNPPAAIIIVTQSKKTILERLLRVDIGIDLWNLEKGGINLGWDYLRR